MDGIGFMAIDRIWTPDCIYMLRKVMLKKKRKSPSISIHSFVSLLVCSFSDIHHSIPHGIFFVSVSMASGSHHIFFLFAKNYVTIMYHSVSIY